jgi:DNA-binding response OmpR family regulator
MNIGRAPPKGCIVIVEEDDLIRDLIASSASEAGYEIAIDPMPSDRVVLVIADCPQPRQARLLVEGLSTRYGAPVLLTSARLSRHAVSDATASRFGVRRVLPKPFSRDDLLEAIEASLR